MKDPPKKPYVVPACNKPTTKPKMRYNATLQHYLTEFGYVPEYIKPKE